ncbi:family 78 glycoside hydrolase catalytic domain [Larkinella terrae]|uniref:alpha-L-rhamnosidase n=1 Tax=Larkinella terrae TaxID=2025311 RepID=A0A7K0EKX4_9BACT|nr:family 78 glycoside hydrolase catalytic domain [Larkinella terrae]MRS62503.1 Bacterial alpha-L-rhamnosidase [Larkinella terrae]
MNWILYGLVLCLSFPTLAQRTITISDLRTENLTNPDGLAKSSPRFSWILTSNQRNLKQDKYQILVASTPEKLSQNEGDLWNSGLVTSDRSQWVAYAGQALSSRQSCYWKVKIRSKDGVESSWSQPARWTMGLMQSSDWTAQWIGLDQTFEWDSPTAVNTRLSARYFRKQATLSKPIKQATAYISGLGLYELSLNGQKVGDAVLAPGPTEYDKRVLYNTYDVTSYLQSGDNAFGVTLGNGRFFGMRIGLPKTPATTNYGYPKLRLQVEITYTDGTTEKVVSDNSWKVTADGPIRANSEFDGEVYDATRELTGWDQAGYNASSWLTAPVVSAPASRIESQTNPPIRVTQNLTPVSVRQLEPGKYIIDMGQNMVGWARLKVEGPRGTQVTMRFAETIKNDGNLMIDNLRSAEAKDVYTLKGGGPEIWEPRFTYHGFRYIELTGFPGTPTTQTLEGRIVHDDLPQTGTITTSNDMLNKIYKNAFWSIRGNYRGIPTDCPQRDERQGWLGDRATVSTGESFIYGNQSLYAKWLDDIESAQKSDGAIPDIVPTYWKYATPSVTWPSTYVLVANMLYEQFGDDEPIRKHYSSMKKWVTYLEKYSSNYIQQADEYGDWALPPESMSLTKSEDPTRKTDGTLMNTAYYYYILKLMERFATLTGNEGDRANFSNRAALVRAAFNQKFFNPSTNQYSNNTVTASLVALGCGLVPDELRQAVFNQMTAVIEGKFNGQISTGVVGTQWLMRTLTANGRSDLAMRLATNTGYPSWGYMVQNGATTTWELWNGNKAPSFMNSGNHVMLLGDLPIWMYENLAGIKSGESGFKSLVMRPVPSGDLNRVSSTFASAYGTVASEWTLSGQQFRWKITVPGNTTALVSVPAQNLASVREGSQPAEEANGVTFLRMEDGRAIFQVGSGSYDFTSTPTDAQNRPPVAPGFTPPSGVVNKAYTYTLPAFTDPEGGEVTHALSGTIAGLSFNPATRVLSGTPTQAGTFPLVAQGTDTEGASTTATLSIVVSNDLASFDGYLDKVRCDSITGWAWNRDRPNYAVTIEFLEGTNLATATPVGTTVANIFRQDLKTAGKGNGIHGYRFKVPESLKDNQTHTIWGRAEGIYVLKWSPKTLTCEGTTTPPPVNQPPVAPAVASLTATTGVAFSTTLPAFTDADNDPLTYSLAGSVAGLNFNPATRVLSGTPTATGTFSLTYSASDGTVSVPLAFSISVENPPVVNTPPVAPVLTSLTITSGQSFTTTLLPFTDVDDDPLTYSLAGSVPGLTFDAASRGLSGIPTTTGTFSLTYSATDGTESVATTFSIVVESPPVVNLPPVAPEPASLSATVGTAFSTTLTTFTDPENESLTYNLAGSVPGLSFTAGSRILSGTPTTAGTYSLTYTATDSQNQSASVNVSVVVSNTVTSPGLSLAGYDGYLSTVNCTIFSGWVWHRDKPNLALTVEFLDGATAATATVIDKILADDFRQDLKNNGKGNGYHGYSYVVPESLKDSKSHTIWARVEGTTYVLRPPTNKLINCAGTTPPPVTNKPPVEPAPISLTATVGQAFSTTLAPFTDPDNNPLTYSLTGSVPGLSFNSASRVLNGTATQAGSFTLTYTANDGTVTVSTPVRVTVVAPAPVNNPPAAPSIASLSATVGQAFSTTLAVFTDPDNDPLTYSVTGTIPGLSFNAATRVLSGTPTQAGSFSLTFSANDGKVTVSTPVLMTVVVPAPTNKPPVAPTIASLSATVGQSFSTSLAVFTDPDNDPLSYSATGTIPGLSFNAANRVLSGTPTQAGSFSLTYSANDGKATVSTPVRVEVVAPANRPPVAPSIASLSATTGQSFSTTLAVFTDPDNNPLTYSVTGTIPGLSFSTTSRVLSGTPTQAGSFTLTYSANDGKTTVSTPVLMTVVAPAPTNKPPVAPTIATLNATVGQAFSTTLTAFTDPDNNPLTHSMTGTAPGLSFNPPNRVLSGTPTQAGSFSLTYSANDGKVASSTTVRVTVASAPPANKPPVAPSIASLTATIGQAFTTTLAAFSDPENGALTYSLTGQPGWLSFNGTNRTLSGTPDLTGTYSLTYAATDNKNAKTSLTVTLTVNPVPVTGNFEGYLDVITCNSFSGWIWNKDKPNAAVTIEFLEGSTLATAKVFATTVANILRQDLKDAGKGNGAHGYNYTVPQTLKNNQERIIWGRVQGNSYILVWSPKSINCSPNQRIGADNSVESESLLELSVTPNPTTGLVTARFRLAENEKARLRVTDLLGRTLHQQDVRGTGRPQEETIDLGSNTPGMHFIHLKTDLKTQSGRILLTR